ncbi:hypothetical protein OMW55_08245 [Sphingomonas sp. BN140010]|uniref:Secreted protein n=1 Tax=Sphingomonas arvum TaxID=2992113 RepID=A0ABT3JFD6_9SPHN|nr:hypothetical protein [Sphingomonas sp. BN140010]MCW3797792.1 hypothetical protein [Sphingomonas sp. BN140010]
MGPVAYVIAILGCSDGSAACTTVQTMPAHYASEASCSAATGSVLAQSTDFDFPTIVAECRAVRSVPAAQAKERPTRTGVLTLEG